MMMTKEEEEASKTLTQYIDYDAETPDYYEMEKACKVAIKALEQEPCDKCVYSTKDGYCQYDDITETIPPFEPLPLVTPKPKTDILDKIKAVAIKWKTDTWTDYLSYECMCEIANILAESEDNNNG